MTLGLNSRHFSDMANNVKFEVELYEPMRSWLQTHLAEVNPHAQVVTVDSHAQTLDVVLERLGAISEYPQVIGLDIQIDVLGVVKQKGRTTLTFIEAKKTALNLHDLGQLWAYCKLCDPSEAYLLSSVGLGSLNKILNGLLRTDLLAFGDQKKIKSMRVGKWDVAKKSIDVSTLVPSVL